MKKNILIALALTLTLLLSACGAQTAPSAAEATEGANNADSSGIEAPASADAAAAIDVSGIFSDRDFETAYDDEAAAHITLRGDTASCPSDAVEINGGVVTITDEGAYVLTGALDNGMIIVNTEKTDKTQLVLNGVSIRSESSAAIYILQSDKVFITLAEGSENTLSNGGAFTAIDENNIDAVVFSKEDVTFNGSGSLSVSSPAGHGIVSKDSLTVTGGVYNIVCASHAMSGKDEVGIADGKITIASGKDGIHAENSDDASLGNVYIEKGVFKIEAEGDGISAAGAMLIEDGAFDIISGGGSENAAQHSSDAWGSFGGRGGGMGRPTGGGMGNPPEGDMGRPADGGMGNPPEGGADANRKGEATREDFTPPAQTAPTAAALTAEDESASIKGVKAGGNLTINGGSFAIDAADDAVHTNGDMTINGGSFVIAAGDDAFHGDKTLTLAAGTINVSESYEGIEALDLRILGGDITLAASDDGLNAAGGGDASGMGGRDNGKFGGGGWGAASGSGSILIAGGTLHINASGDGIDANGTLEITGGHTVVVGPTQGDTATLDYDSSGVISGGTFIGTGASGMAQSFSSSENQGVVAVNVGNRSAGTELTLKDASGNLILSHTPELPFDFVVLSSPDIEKGASYTLTVGSAAEELTAS